MVLQHRRNVPIVMHMLVLCAMIALPSGCEKPPATNADDVYDYVRNGVAGAHVRRLDDAGQEYVDRVFTAYQTWKKANAGVRKLADLPALPPLDDKDWRNRRVAKETLDAITKWRERDHKDGLSEIADAVEELPNVLPGTRYTEQNLAESVNKALDATDTSWMDEYAKLFEQLLTIIADRDNKFDSESEGLTFASAETTSKAQAIWHKLHDKLEPRQAEALAETIRTMETDHKRREAELDIKTELKAEFAEKPSEELRRRIRESELLFQYYDTRFKTAEARKRKLAPPKPED